MVGIEVTAKDQSEREHALQSLRTLGGFFNVPQKFVSVCKCYEGGPTVYRPYPRRPESLTICRCHYKRNTFSIVLLKTLNVRSGRGLNPRPHAR